MDAEKKRIVSLLGEKASTLEVAVAQLYMAHQSGGPWTYTGKWGIVSMTISRSGSGAQMVLQLYNYDTLALEYQEELYEGMQYHQLSPEFHSFEGSTALVGLSFSDASSASSFASRVSGMIPKKMTLVPIQRTEEPKKKGFFSRMKSIFKKDDNHVGEIGLPTNVQRVAHIGYDPDNGFQVENLPPEWRSMFKQAGVKKKDLRNPETAAQIYQTIQQATGGPPGGPPPPPGGAAPRPVGRAPPPGRGPPSRAPPPARRAPPMRGRAPPPVPAVRAAPPPVAPVYGSPAAPPVPVGAGPPAAPPVAPLAPPVPVGAGPPAAPPVAPAAPPVAPGAPPVPAAAKAPPPVRAAPPAAAPDVRGGLLSAIQNFSGGLRKVTEEEKKADLPDLQDMDASATSGLLANLKMAMASRRGVVADEESDEEEDDWSD